MWCTLKEVFNPCFAVFCAFILLPAKKLQAGDITSDSTITIMADSRTPLILTDHWEFRYSNERDSLGNANKVRVSIPFNWATIPETGRVGYGQYSLLLNNPQEATLGILFPFVNTELQVYANNTLLFQSKYFDPENPIPYQPGKLRPLVKLPADTLIELQVIVRNAHAFRPGIRRAPRISAYESIYYEEEKRKAFEYVGLGILFIIFVYHLLLFVFLRLSAHLWLACISLIVFVRGAVVYDSFFVLYHFFPQLQFSLAKKLEYGLLYWTPVLLLLLFQSQFRVRKYDAVVQWVFIICCALFLFVCATPVHLFERTLYAFHLLIVVCLFISLDIIRKAVVDELPTAKITLFGMLMTFLLVIVEILKNYAILHLDFGSNILNNAVVVYIFIQAVALSAQMARVYRENEYLNKNLEESVEKKTIELSEANAAKTKILAVVSHDLKSPLASLKGSLQLLEMDVFGKSEFEKVKQGITEQISHNTNMIQEVLQWSSLELKKEKDATSFSICQLETASMQALRQVRQLAHEKQVKLLNEVTSVMVKAELDVLVIILRNLVANAVKFTNPRGYVRITSKVSPEKIRVSVVDNGVGMPDEMKQLILHSHSTKSRRGTRSEKGTGVGLLIVKDLLHQLESCLEIADNPDSPTGTVFTFEVKRE